MDDPLPTDSSQGSQAEPPDFAALYDELRALAQRRLAELPPGQTLQPTALVNEAWLRIAGRDSPLPPGRRTLVFLVSRAMRDLLVEDARRKAALKRGGTSERVPLDAQDLLADNDHEELLAVHDALRGLEAEDPDSAQVVALRYFAGLSVPEVAEALGVSVSTVERQWTYARAWLRRSMSCRDRPSA
jgi:RNA polymerase sigma factor (TIGR02999 family)